MEDKENITCISIKSEYDSNAKFSCFGIYSVRNRVSVVLIMMAFLEFLFASILIVILYTHRMDSLGPDFSKPEQIHISYGKAEGEMVVTWVTKNLTGTTAAQYGTSSSQLVHTAVGNYTRFTDGGTEKRILHIYKAVLTQLKPDRVYYYRIESGLGFSDVYHFKTMKSGTDWSPLLVVYGDLGTTNGISLPMLQKEAQNSSWDAIYHIGDLAYNLADDNARIGDEFMNQIQPIAAHVPYMTCPGNHEYHYHFSNYINRFNNPTPEGHPMYYSFNIGPAHIITVSTELYFYNDWGYKGADKEIIDQIKFLSEDLKEANKPENRAKRPWIIAMGHRPIYCSNADKDACASPVVNPERIGHYNKTTGILAPGLEDIFYKQGVDLQIYAHEHSYERLWPIYDMLVCNGTRSPYVNPRAPVHITTGSAGSKERMDPFLQNPLYFSAVRIEDYGFTKLQIHNATHLSIQQISSDQGGKVVDDFHIVKDKHGPGLYDCHNK